MTGHGAKFGHKKEAAIAALLSQRNQEEAARVAGISVKTLARWQKVPDFQTAYLEARRTVVTQAGARLQQGTPLAASILMKTMIDPSAPAATRAKAATNVLSLALRGMELEDLAIRVNKLERAAERKKGARDETDNED